MLEIPELWGTCQGKVLTGRGTSPRETSLWQSTNPEGVKGLKNTWMSDMEMHNLECASLQF